jgi:hypothetical protein
MTERHLDLLQKHRELQKAFDDTLEMNRKLGSENWKLEKENEELKQQVSYLKDNLRVARKDRENLRNDIANGLKEFVKELPFTSMRLLAIKEVKEENELLQQKWLESEYEKSKLVSQIEKMKCCHSCLSHKLNNLKNCQTCDGNYSKWELAE